MMLTFPKSSLRAMTRPLVTTLMCLLLLVGAGKSFGSVPLAHAPGAPAGSYALSDLETINLYNGQLNFTLPLMGVGGRSRAVVTTTLRVPQWFWFTAHVPPDNEAGDPGWPYAENGEYSGSQSIYGVGGVTGGMIYTDACPFNASWPVYVLARIHLTTPDGTRYEFRSKQNNGRPYQISCATTGVSLGNEFITADGTATTFISDVPIRYLPQADPAILEPTGYVKFSDGTQYRIDKRKISWVQDSNGNRVSFTYDSLNRLTSVTDSLNRTTTVCHANTSGCPNVPYDQITYSGFGGSPRTIKVRYASLRDVLRPGMAIPPKLFPEFPNDPNDVRPYNPRKVSSIELPDGRSYKLYYNPYGELARVELPTGGAYEYDHTPGSGVLMDDPFYQIVSRRLVKRRVYPNGGTGSTFERETVYEASYDYSTSPPTSIITEKHYKSPAQGGQLTSATKHYYHGDARDSLIKTGWPLDYAPWLESREYKTESLDAATLAVIKSVEYKWEQRAPVTWWESPYCRSTLQCTSTYAPPNDPRITEIKTTFKDVSPHLVSKTVHVFDDDVPFNNIADVYRYDFGEGAPGPLLMREHTDYVTTANYINVNSNPAFGASLRRLPEQQWISTDLNGTNKVSLAVYDYDQFELTDCPSIIGHDPAYSTALVNRGNLTTVTRYSDASAAAGAVVSSYHYDIAGNTLSVTDPNSNTSSVAFTDADGDTLQHMYAFPTTKTSAIPDPGNTGFGSAAPLVSSSTYDSSTGHMISSTDINGRVTTFDYTDPLDRIKQVTRPDGGTTLYSYDRSANAGIVNDYVRTLSSLDASRAVEDYQFFDGLGRPVRSLINEGGSPVVFLTVDTQYDAMGNVSAVSNPYRNNGATEINPSGRWTTTVYDSLGRVRSLTTPDGAVVHSLYVGNSLTATDQAGKKRRSVTDALGRLRYIYEDPAGQNLQTSYTYDPLGNLRRIVQDTQQRFFMYDSLSRLIRVKHAEQAAGSAASNVTDPLTGNNQWSAAYGYDPNGNLTTRVDARNVTTTSAYDPVNRLKTVRYTDGTKDIDVHYDGAVNGKGRLWYFNWDPNNNSRFDTHIVVDEYDVMGRTTKYRQQFLTNGVASPHFTVLRSYDLAGNVTSQTYPSGRAVTYNYDAAGRLGDAGGQPAFSGNIGDGVSRTYSAGVSYSEFGPIREERFGTQTPLYHKQHFNWRGQLYDIRLSTQPIHADQWDWNRGAIVNYFSSNYEWGGHPGSSGSGTDNNGNLLKSYHWVPGNDSYSSYTYTQQTYTYDALNRLTAVAEHPGTHLGQEAQSYAQTYDYDRWGNRSINAAGTWVGQVANPPSPLVPEPQFAVTAASNRLNVPEGQTGRMDYDAAGNLINDTYTSYGRADGLPTRLYDAQNRLTTVKDGNLQVVSQYTYDAVGRRVKRRIGGQEVWQIYGIDGELVADYYAGAAPFLPTKEYAYRAGALLFTATSGDPDRMTRFIKNLYYNALARDPSAAEMQQQTTALTNAGVQGQSQLLTTARASARSIFESAAYAGRGRTDSQYVGDLYNAYLQRGPDQGGLDHWVNHTQQHGRGATLNAFEVCMEFERLVQTLHGIHNGGDNQRVEHFVRTFYYGARRTEPTAAEAQQQTERLNNAVAQGEAQVIAEARAMGAEVFQATNYNSDRSAEQYVGDLYQAFLQRAPDEGGLNHWVGFVQTHGRPLGVTAFQQSIEFTNLARTLYRETFWLVSDHLGTPRMVVNKSGTLGGVKRHDYLPFGEELPAGIGGRTGDQGYGRVDNVREKFTGKERDGETALDYFGGRYYSNALGRFSSVDPLRASARTVNPQSLNRYSYALNRPTIGVDPNGLSTIIVTVKPADNTPGPRATVELYRGSGVRRGETYSGLAAGQNRDRTKSRGDTPFGVYKAPPTWTTQGGKFNNKLGVAYGTGKVNFTGAAGEIIASGRKDIRIHGGGTGLPDSYALAQELIPTEGCVRLLNMDVNSLVEHINELAGNGDPLDRVFVGDAEYLAALAEQKDGNGAYLYPDLRLGLGLYQTPAEMDSLAAADSLRRLNELMLRILQEQLESQRRARKTKERAR